MIKIKSIKEVADKILVCDIYCTYDFETGKGEHSFGCHYRTLADLEEVRRELSHILPMTYDSLRRDIQKILPYATFSEDNDGQLIIYTDMRFAEDNQTLVDFDASRSCPQPEEENDVEEARRSRRTKARN